MTGDANTKPAEPRRSRADAGFAALRIVGYGMIWLGLVLLSVAGTAVAINNLLPPL